MLERLKDVQSILPTLEKTHLEGEKLRVQNVSYRYKWLTIGFFFFGNICNVDGKKTEGFGLNNVHLLSTIPFHDFSWVLKVVSAKEVQRIERKSSAWKVSSTLMEETGSTWILKMNRLRRLRGERAFQHNAIKQKCSAGSQHAIVLDNEYTNLIVQLVFEKEIFSNFFLKIVQD